MYNVVKQGVYTSDEEERTFMYDAIFIIHYY